VSTPDLTPERITRLGRTEVMGLLQDLSSQLETSLSQRITRGLQEVTSELRSSLSPSRDRRSPRTSSPKSLDHSASRHEYSESHEEEEKDFH